MTERTVQGHTVRRLVPHARTEGVELLSLPGGGYVHPMVSQHWWIIRNIIKRTGAAVTIALYPSRPSTPSTRRPR